MEGGPRDVTPLTGARRRSCRTSVNDTTTVLAESGSSEVSLRRVMKEMRRITMILDSMSKLAFYLVEVSREVKLLEALY